MPDARPFHALRYDPAVVGDWGAVLGPPYDIITADERAALLAASPYQITHVESAPDAAAQAQAAARLREWRDAGALLRDTTPAYYLAEHTFTHHGVTHRRLSLYAAVRLTPWDAGHVLPHEWTMSGPKVERLALLDAVRANISPVFCLMPDRNSAVDRAMQAAMALPVTTEGVDANGEQHTLRVVADPALVEALQAALAAETFYIADGHHRYESALQYRDQRAAASSDWSDDAPENFVLMGVVRAEDPGLIVGPTHRIVHRATPPDDLLGAIGALFDVEAAGTVGDGVAALEHRVAAAGQDGPAIGAVGLDGDRCYVLRATDRTRAAFPASVPASWAALDVAILQYGLLEPVLGINDAALTAGGVVTYSHEPDVAFAAAATGDAPYAFLLNAPTMPQIFDAADAGDRMPQKSTYFTPKLPTGVVLYPFDA